MSASDLFADLGTLFGTALVKRMIQDQCASKRLTPTFRESVTDVLLGREAFAPVPGSGPGTAAGRDRAPSAQTTGSTAAARTRRMEAAPLLSRAPFLEGTGRASGTRGMGAAGGTNGNTGFGGRSLPLSTRGPRLPDLREVASSATGIPRLTGSDASSADTAANAHERGAGQGAATASGTSSARGAKGSASAPRTRSSGRGGKSRTRGSAQNAHAPRPGQSAPIGAPATPEGQAGRAEEAGKARDTKALTILCESVVSCLPGRVRIRHAGLADADACLALAGTFGKSRFPFGEGEKAPAVAFNPVTGSALFTFAPHTLTVTDFLLYALPLARYLLRCEEGANGAARNR